ncbi:hypothetical protein B0H13DRAFT_2278041 [Mycena leptocephala]|nr:hypothetical protein B0H13DRAFT_2278041 [Mycena leptocephala]
MLWSSLEILQERDSWQELLRPPLPSDPVPGLPPRPSNPVQRRVHKQIRHGAGRWENQRAGADAAKLTEAPRIPSQSDAQSLTPPRSTPPPRCQSENFTNATLGEGVSAAFLSNLDVVFLCPPARSSTGNNIVQSGSLRKSFASARSSI